MYDVGLPLPRSWLYGIGGLIVVIATFAIGYFIASRDPPRAAVTQESAAMATDAPADDVLVARAAAEPAQNFPAFAPEGVIVVSAPSRDERAFAEARERFEQPSRPVESAQRRARSNEPRPPVAVARPEPRERELAELSEPETNADERPSRDEAPAVRDDGEDANRDEETSDSRSWYGSEEYRREVEERRRAEREGRRRRSDGS